MPSAVAYHYGLGGRVPSYEETISLYLNIPELNNAESFRQFAVATTASDGSLPFEWLSAAVPNPVDAAKWKNWDLKRSHR